MHAIQKQLEDAKREKQQTEQVTTPFLFSVLPFFFFSSVLISHSYLVRKMPWYSVARWTWTRARRSSCSHASTTWSAITRTSWIRLLTNTSSFTSKSRPITRASTPRCRAALYDEQNRLFVCLGEPMKYDRHLIFLDPLYPSSLRSLMQQASILSFFGKSNSPNKRTQGQEANDAPEKKRNKPSDECAVRTLQNAFRTINRL